MGIFSVELRPLTDVTIPQAVWQRFEDVTRQERGLMEYDSDTLRERFERDQAALVWHDGHIVAYISVVPALDAARRDLLKGLLSTAVLPTTDVYIGISGWTHPQWRRRGLASGVRRWLYGRYMRAGNLVVVSTIGMGGSPVVSKLGFRLVGWSQLPYVTSVEGWFRPPDDWYVLGQGWQRIAGLIPYDGPHRTPADDPDHEWAKYSHFWVSDEILAQPVDAQIAAAVGGDLYRWRDSLAAIASA